MENKECRKYEYGKQGLWKKGVWKIRSMENKECGK